MTFKYCDQCHDLEKRLLRYGLQVRVAFDLAPRQLIASVSQCCRCAIILNAIQQFVPETQEIESSIARIYARGPAELPPHTLSLEVYFKVSRPKLEVEIYAKCAKDLSGMYVPFR